MLGNIEAVVLAGGLATRAGGDKMRLKIGDNSLIQRSVLAFLNVCTRVIVVLGHRADEVKDELDGSKFKNVDFVHNQRYEQGMFSCVKAGVREIRGERFFLTPGDYPFIKESICENMLREQGEIIIPSFKNKCGHPILLDSSLRDEILNEDEASNLRKVLERRRLDVRYYEADSEDVLFDIDTKDDYLKARGIS